MVEIPQFNAGRFVARPPYASATGTLSIHHGVIDAAWIAHFPQLEKRLTLQSSPVQTWGCTVLVGCEPFQRTGTLHRRRTNAEVGFLRRLQDRDYRAFPTESKSSECAGAAASGLKTRMGRFIPSPRGRPNAGVVRLRACGQDDEAEPIGWADPSTGLYARRWRGLIRRFSMVGLEWGSVQTLPS